MNGRITAVHNHVLSETAYRIDWPDGGNTRLVLADTLDHGQRVQRFNREIRNGSAKGEARWMLFCTMLETEKALRDWESSALFKRLGGAEPKG